MRTTSASAPDGKTERDRFQAGDPIRFKFVHKDTLTKLCFDLFPLLNQIVAEEFLAIMTLQHPVGQSEQIDIDDSANLLIALLTGYVNSIKKAQFDYWVNVDELLSTECGQDLDDKIDAFCKIW